MLFPERAVGIFEKVFFVDGFLGRGVSLEGVDDQILIPFFGDWFVGPSGGDKVGTQADHPFDIAGVEFLFKIDGVGELFSELAKAGGGAAFFPKSGATDCPANRKAALLELGDGVQHRLGVCLPAQCRP